jgi:hypothetical protein
MFGWVNYEHYNANHSTFDAGMETHDELPPELPFDRQ